MTSIIIIVIIIFIIISIIIITITIIDFLYLSSMISDWISFLSYSNLFVIKDFVVVVGVGLVEVRLVIVKCKSLDP
jgi:hypothetical protein